MKRDLTLVRFCVVKRSERASRPPISAVRELGYAVAIDNKPYTRTILMRNAADTSHIHFQCRVSTNGTIQRRRIALGNSKEDRDHRILVVCVLARIKQGVSVWAIENQVLVTRGFVTAVGIHTNTPFKRSSQIHTYFGLPYQPAIELTYIF